MKQFTLFVVLIQIAHNKFEGRMNKERICPVMIGKETQIRLVNKLENIHHVVVQASALVGSNVFALQLLHKQSDVIVYQTPNDSGTVTFDENHPILFLKGQIQLELLADILRLGYKVEKTISGLLVLNLKGMEILIGPRKLLE